MRLPQERRGRARWVRPALTADSNGAALRSKGRAGVGRRRAHLDRVRQGHELGDDYWLYLVLDCSTPSPRLYRVQNPSEGAGGPWEPALNVHYGVAPIPSSLLREEQIVDDRRLIEERLPLAVNAESAREKSIRHGHISTMHLWWARRPLAMSRAVVFGTLLPDPGDDAERNRSLAFSSSFAIRSIGNPARIKPLRKLIADAYPDDLQRCWIALLGVEQSRSKLFDSAATPQQWTSTQLLISSRNASWNTRNASGILAFPVRVLLTRTL